MWYIDLSPNSWTFCGGWKVGFSRRAVFSKVRVYKREQHLFVDSKYYLCKQLRKSQIRPNDLTSMFYIEALHSHFQSNFHFKAFKNSGSGYCEETHTIDSTENKYLTVLALIHLKILIQGIKVLLEYYLNTWIFTGVDAFRAIQKELIPPWTLFFIIASLQLGF